MKIVDCFTFYNELDLLTYRLNLLDNIVDYFIIVESTHTHVGKEKTLFFNENKHLFQKFTNKIIHIIVDDFPHKYNNVAIAKDKVWENEFFQRNAISRGIKSVKDLADTEPWKTVKVDPARVETMMNIALQITANLSIVLQPFLPNTATRLSDFLKFNSSDWDKAGASELLNSGHVIDKPEILFGKIDDEFVENEIARLKNRDSEQEPA